MNKTGVIFSIGQLLLLSLTISSSVSTARAEADLILEPERAECSVQSNPGYWSCDLKYDQVVVVEGRAAAPAKAQGDCAVCRNFMAVAQKKNLYVGVRRYLNWNSPDLLYLTADEVPSGAAACEPPPVGRSRPR
jgi:hypothetical protein